RGGVDHPTRRRNGVLILPAKEKGGRPVVLRFHTRGESLDHQVGERRQALRVARVGEHRRELLGGARFVGNELQRFDRRLHRSGRVPGDGEQARQLDPDGWITRLTRRGGPEPVASGGEGAGRGEWRGGAGSPAPPAASERPLSAASFRLLSAAARRYDS